MQGRVLIIAGSDSGGGAGIQADIKAVTALNGFAMTAITALTAQNTLGVHDVYPVPTEFIQKQISVVLDDIGCDVIKTGMLGTTPVIKAVVQSLQVLASDALLVVDPVMVAKGGTLLLEADAVETVKTFLLPLATIITPNLFEAEALTGLTIKTEDHMIEAAKILMTCGPQAVLLKGGHLEGPNLVDILLTKEGVSRFTGQRIESRHTHGTGCTLASAIACGLGQGLSIVDAVTRGRIYVRKAMETAPGFGKGHGPLNHAHTVV